jgi:glutamate formiminotransferase/formiminotetrahydrofolate cyclodeaminase
MSLREFVDLTSTEKPAPGGGSVAAVCGALASALACMVAQLTVGKKGYEGVSEQMKALAEHAQEHKDFFLRAVDDDTAAFNRVMQAFRLPRKTEEQKRERKLAIQAATRGATLVPMEVLRRAKQVLDLIEQATRDGNKNSLSDAGVAGLCARAAAEGARYNVLINLADIDDSDFVNKLKKESSGLIEDIRRRTDSLAGAVEQAL